MNHLVLNIALDQRVHPSSRAVTPTNNCKSVSLRDPLSTKTIRTVQRSSVPQTPSRSVLHISEFSKSKLKHKLLESKSSRHLDYSRRSPKVARNYCIIKKKTPLFNEDLMLYENSSFATPSGSPRKSSPRKAFLSKEEKTHSIIEQ